jgi:hypothetical protein
VTVSRITPAHWGPEGAGLLVTLPPFHFAPRGAVPIDLSQGTTTALAGGQTATLITIEVPAMSELRIIQVGFSAVDPTALQFSSWSITRDGQALYDYNTIPTAIGTIDAPATIDLHVGGRATIELKVTNNFNSPSSWNYAARARGWIYQGTV